MIIDEELIKNFDDNTAKIRQVRSWLEKLYYDPEFSTLFNRPVLSFLMTGCDYLITNFIELKTRYLAGGGD